MTLYTLPSHVIAHIGEAKQLRVVFSLVVYPIKYNLLKFYICKDFVKLNRRAIEELKIIQAAIFPLSC